MATASSLGKMQQFLLTLPWMWGKKKSERIRGEAKWTDTVKTGAREGMAEERRGAAQTELERILWTQNGRKEAL